MTDEKRCDYCGGPMEFTSIPCPDKRQGCAVCHRGWACPKCGIGARDIQRSVENWNATREWVLGLNWKPGLIRDVFVLDAAMSVMSIAQATHASIDAVKVAVLADLRRRGLVGEGAVVARSNP